MIGPEHRRRRLTTGGAPGHDDGGGGRGFRALLVHVDKRFVDHVGDQQLSGPAAHAREVGGASKRFLHAHLGKRRRQRNSLRRLELRQADDHFLIAQFAEPTGKFVCSELLLEVGDSVHFLGQQYDHRQILAGIGQFQRLE